MRAVGNPDGGIVSHLLLASRATVYGSKDEWLLARKAGIGSSEAAPIILGSTAWASRYSVWCDKTGRAERGNTTTREQHWGHRLEPVIAHEYETATGRALVNPGPFTIARSNECPFMFATHDRLIVKAQGHEGPGILSIKTADKEKARDWRSGAPLDYQIQLQHEFAVSGMSWGSFAVLIGGNDFITFDVEANPEFIAKLKSEAFKFWGLVERNEEPAIDSSEATYDALKRRYPVDDGEEIDLPLEAIEWDHKLVEAKREIKVWEQAQRYYENQIIARLGNAAKGKLPDGTRYSYKTIKRAEHIVHELSFRALRRMKGAASAA